MIWRALVHSLLIGGMLTPGAHASASSASPSSPSPIRIDIPTSHVDGRHLAKYLALTCEPASWKEFAVWAKRERFTTWRPSRSFNGTVTADGHVRLNDGKIDIHRDNMGMLHALVDGRTLAGRDPCAMLNDLHQSLQKSGRHSAWIDAVLPGAFAIDVVHEDRTHEDIMLGVTSAFLVAGIFFPPATLIGLAFLAFDAADAFDAIRTLATKVGFEGVLNGDFSLTCSEQTMRLNCEQGEIIVRKLAGVSTVEYHMKDPLRQAMMTDSKDAPSSRKLLIAMATDCKNQEDAKVVQEKIKFLKGQADDQVAAIDQPIPTMPELQAPPAAGPPPVPGSAPVVN